MSTQRSMDTQTRTCGVLQQLQMLMSNDATLLDVSHVILSMQQEFGTHASLEQVIQTLVGRHLAHQTEQRRALKGCEAHAHGPERKLKR